MQVDLFGTVPERLYRKRDVETSAQAAGKVDFYRARHEAKIFAALVEAGPMGATAAQMARTIRDLDSVQISRRLAGMERRGLIERRRAYTVDTDGIRPGSHIVKRGNFCVWWAK